MPRRSRLYLSILFVLGVLIPRTAHAATPKFDAIYVFGDSYCDVGNWDTEHPTVFGHAFFAVAVETVLSP